MKISNKCVEDLSEGGVCINIKFSVATHTMACLQNLLNMERKCNGAADISNRDRAQ